MKLSVIIPVYNEAKNIAILLPEVRSVLEASAHTWEIIVVNDGSHDASWSVIHDAARNEESVKAINFKRNYGQTSALSAGIAHASGDILIPIDSDLENDPHDITRLLTKLEEGFDVVSGWRQQRWADQALTRKLPSRLANSLISLITGVHLHDYGCTLKVYRKEVIEDVELYGEMHRFIPAYASWSGARITELPISYRPRRFGVSNYGISRTFRVILDLIVITFLTKYMDRPMHFFGGIGFVSLGIGFLAGLTALLLKVLALRTFVSTPLPVFSALFIIVGVQLIVMGIIAEIQMRTYYESQKKTSYIIRETINI